MCSGQEQSNSISSLYLPSTENRTNIRDMNHVTAKTEDSLSSLHELAANNDVDGFKCSLERDSSAIHKVGIWYGRKKGSKQMVLEHKTPLMVAATYGSLDVLKLILSKSKEDNVNFSCDSDKITALHCAVSGASVNSVEVVKLLLLAGANPNRADANGRFPIDEIIVPPKLNRIKASLEELLTTHTSGKRSFPVTIADSKLNSPVLSSSENKLMVSLSDSISFSVETKFNDVPNPTLEKKEYPVDPSLPDIKNSIYSTDEFRMYLFKVRPCSRAYSHDWTECPFVHPGENARRRDPRKFHYSCVPCPEFRKGSCRRNDLCEYAHGVFECWLHPAQYRTRLCKDGTSCMRRVCFFAHRTDELRPLYVSTGSGMPSPRSPSLIDISAMSPNGISHYPLAWPQPNVPTLHLPGNNLQSSRLRSSLNARDIPSEDFLHDFEAQQPFYRSVRSKALTPSKLEDLFSSEMSSSPRYSDHAASSMFSRSPKSAVMNHYQLPPINTGMFSQNVDGHIMQGRMSPISSPMGCQQFRSLSTHDFGFNTVHAVVGSPSSTWSKWESPSGKLDWSVNVEDKVAKTRVSSSFEPGDEGDEPDLSWVQSLVKELPNEVKDRSNVEYLDGEILNSNTLIESVDHSVLGAWLDQMNLDELGV